MELTQGQLQLIAQVAPVFMLVIVVERREVMELIRSYDPGATVPAWIGIADRRMGRLATVMYLVILGLDSIASVFMSGDSDGVEGGPAALVGGTFAVGALLVVIFSAALVVRSDDWPR